MKKTFLRHLAVLLVMSVSAGTLMHISQSVNRAEKQLTRLELSITGEKESKKILQAEWSLLNSPERIEVLAKKYLNLSLPQPAQLVSEPGSIGEYGGEEEAGLIPVSAEMQQEGTYPAVIPRKPDRLTSQDEGTERP